MVSLKYVPTLLGPLALMGCATSGSSPIDVTRFHRAQEMSVAPAAYTLENPAGFGGASLEAGVWNDAVAAELGKLGYQRSNGSASYVVTVRHERGVIDPAMGRRRSPVSVGVGGSTGSYGSGVGLGIGIDLSGPPKPRIGDDLSVTIARASDKEVVWEGRASGDSKQGTGASQPNVMAAKMAAALFQGFPGESGKSIRVP